MANYNFTMKEFNGTSYDILYPKTTSQQVLLNDSALATKLGLSGTPTVDNTLNALESYHFEVTSYVGNGHYGSSYPCSITFTHAPKAVFFIGTGTSGQLASLYDAWTVSGSSASCKFVLNPNSLTTSYDDGSGRGFGYGSNILNCYGKKSVDGKTFSWYDTTDASGTVQLNASLVTYYFLGVW